MLMFCYKFVGIVSYIYVLYSFVSIYTYSKRFKKRRNYVSKGITRIKFYLFFDIFVTVLYQIPLQKLHQNDDELNSWQKIIGIIVFCKFQSNSKDIEYCSMDIIIGKLILFAMIVLYDNFQHSNAFDYFNQKTLNNFISVSELKAECSTYLYNNRKLWWLGLNMYKKDIILQNIVRVESKLSKFTQNYMKPFEA